MAKIELHPIVSSISGRIGNIVFFPRYGRQYARSYCIPANPKTELQQKNRKAFAYAVGSWQRLSLSEKAAWNKKGEKKKRSGYHLFLSGFMKQNMNAVHQGPDNSLKQKYPSPYSTFHFSPIHLPYRSVSASLRYHPCTLPVTTDSERRFHPSS